MTPATLRRLVAKGEGPTLEFKRSTGELREAMETLCGMVNASGRGRVLFGVSDKGELVGQTVSDGTEREIANATRRIEPTVDAMTLAIRLGAGQSVLVVEASAQSAGPFTFEGRGYVRVGNTTQRMSRSEFDHRTVARLLKETPWDRWIAPGWKVRDLDRDEIYRTVEAAVEAKRLTGVLGERVEVVLRRLELVTDEGVTRAAAILFGKEGGPGFPMGAVRLARFRGVTKDEFRDNRQFTGNAFALLRHAERFLEEHEPVASHFVEGRMERVDTPLYPPLAVREALVNAFIHRDYSIDGGAVSVAMFDDRLEVWSTGTLPEGVTPEKLKGTHDSVPRNRLIAGVFHRRGLIEQWGRGTNRILAEAKKLGCPEPEFEEIAGSFVVRFHRAGAVAPAGTSEGKLTDRQARALEFLSSHGPSRLSEIVRAVGGKVTGRTLQRDLDGLRRRKLINLVGFAKGARYGVVKETRDKRHQ